MRDCTRCGERKEQAEFYTSHSHCKVCRRAASRRRYHDDPKRYKADVRRYTLKKRYGLSLADWAQLLISQAGRCAICESPLDKPHEPHVDHCHETGRIRGLLCLGCNQALGRFGDNVAGLQRAIAYLEAS